MYSSIKNELYFQGFFEGSEGLLSGARYYWDEGLHIDGRYKNLQFKMGGSVMLDSGNIDSDDELERAFPLAVQ